MEYAVAIELFKSVDLGQTIDDAGCKQKLTAQDIGVDDEASIGSLYFFHLDIAELDSLIRLKLLPRDFQKL